MAALTAATHSHCLTEVARQEAVTHTSCQLSSIQTRRRKWWRPSTCTTRQLLGLQVWPATHHGRQAGALAPSSAINTAAEHASLTVPEAQQLLQEHGKGWSALTDFLVAYGLQLPADAIPSLCSTVLSILHRGIPGSGSLDSPFNRYPVLLHSFRSLTQAPTTSSAQPYVNSSLNSCHWEHDEDMLASVHATEPGSMQTNEWLQQPLDAQSAHTRHTTSSSPPGIWTGRSKTRTPEPLVSHPSRQAVQLLAHVFLARLASANAHQAALMALTLADASISLGASRATLHTAGDDGAGGAGKTVAQHQTRGADATVQAAVHQLATRAVQAVTHVSSYPGLPGPQATAAPGAVRPVGGGDTEQLSLVLSAAALAVACIQTHKTFGRAFLIRGVLHAHLNQQRLDAGVQPVAQAAHNDQPLPASSDQTHATLPPGLDDSVYNTSDALRFWSVFRSSTEAAVHQAHSSELVAWLWAHAACDEDVVATQDGSRWFHAVTAALHVHQLTNHQLLDLACALAVLSRASPADITTHPAHLAQPEADTGQAEASLADSNAHMGATMRLSSSNSPASAALRAFDVNGGAGSAAVPQAVLHTATPSTTLEPVLQALLSSRRPLSPAQLIDMLEICAKARLRLSGHSLSKVHSLLAASLPACTCTQLAHAAAAFAKMRTALPAPVLRQLLECFAVHVNERQVTLAEVAALVWALPHISRPYTKWLLQEQRAFLQMLAAITMPALIAVSSTSDPDPPPVAGRAAAVVAASQKRILGRFRPRGSGGLAPKRLGAHRSQGGQVRPSDAEYETDSDDQDEAEVAAGTLGAGAQPTGSHTSATLANKAAAGPQTDARLAGMKHGVVAQPAELVQLVVGFTRLGYYPGADWMRVHRQACITLQSSFTPDNRQRLRNAYQALLLL